MAKIALNFFKIETSKRLINVPYLIYNSKEHFDALKNDSPGTYFQHSKDKIYYWGKNNITPDGHTDLTFNDNRNLILKVIRESLLRQFFQDNNKYRIRKRFHLYSITLKEQDLSNGSFKGLNLYKTFHLHFLPLQIGDNIEIGFTISMSVSENIEWSIEDFKSEGVSYEDLRYNERNGNVYINNKSKYRLAHHFDYASELKKRLDGFNSIQNEYSGINEFIKKFFASTKDALILPDALKIIEFTNFTFEDGNSIGDFQNKVLEKPECYFYRGKYPQNKTNYPKRNKISYNKPFSYDEFENKQIHISVIFPKHLHTEVATFFKHVQKELIETFKIAKDNFKFTRVEIENFNLSSYKRSHLAVSRTRPDIVVIIIDESHEALDTQDSPYFFCKSKFIEQGINTQEVQIQQIQKFLSDKKNQTSNYTDHNIALNIYAKLGGMAWTIKPNEPKNELIIGIGATTDLNGQPILGLTSVFRGDGKYLFGRVSSVTDMNNYQESLEQIVTSTIENSIQDGTLDSSKTLYLIFHIFKPAGKDNKIKALENVVKKFSRHSIMWAFVHIGDGHNYRFFTYIEEGKALKFESKGLGQNNRGTFIKLNNNTSFLGLKSNSSTFIKIVIDSRSSFIDLEYIARQVYQFAEMSHTSYNKSGTPVTIKYPNLMAYFAEKFKEINGFYLEEITMPDNSLWFI